MARERRSTGSRRLSGNLRVENLSYGYRGGFRLSIEHLEFADGVTCLLGPNGAGKSTFIRLVTTAVLPRDGSVFVGATDVRLNLREYRRQLGYLPQRFGMVNNYRVREMLEYAAWMKGVAKKDRPAAIERVAEQCDVTRFLSHRVSALSGGTLRRVGIAQAIVNSPRVIVLDEPTAGLDIVQQGQLYDVVRGLARSAVVVISTHSSSDVAEMGDAVVVFHNGATVFSGSVDSLATGESTSRRESLEEGYRAVIGASGQVR